MRHKYVTRALVLKRTSLKESASLITLLTDDLGLIRARAEGLRKPGAKLASALQTLSETEVTLVRGKEGWRLSGALLTEDHFRNLDQQGRLRAGRVASLLLRLVHEEAGDSVLYDTYLDFLRALPEATEDAQDALECLAALTILRSLGLDAGPLPSIEINEPLSPITRRDIVMRINRGITASGL
ncbi:MAG: DNA repair protein RecO [Parcubacteria bacterium C7867-004]|nr:MAG: DNA repair protein RecO [Parcubacteria bacterium C7867-004]